MCGIVGVFERRGGSPSREVVDRMTDRLTHRGPDGRGTYFDQGVGLGHRRLSIVGLSTGAQPMQNQPGDVVVTYNGEIYNYLALKKQLQEQGYVFRTGSDTEVIVHGYSAWGACVVDRLRGIFAFAVYDKKKQQVLLARDRLGVKPLYFHLSPERLVFASEPKALLLHPDIPKHPDFEAMRLALLYGYVPAPKCAFKGMEQLRPGEVYIVDASEARNYRYWHLPRFGHDRPSNPTEVAAKVDDTVSAELMSEVPLGAFLSGGIDSSIVVASMKHAHLEQKPRAFSIGFPEPDYDESPHAQKVAAHLEVDHTIETVETDALSLLDELVDVYDEPFGDSSAIPTYMLCKLTRKHVTVALSGDGGDEVFAGYRRYKKLAEWSQWPEVAKPLAGAAARLMPLGMRGQASLRRLSQSVGAQYDADLRYFGDRAAQKYFGAELQVDSDWSIAEHFTRAPGSSAVQKAQWTDLHTYLPNDILTKVDRASMAHSLEVRVPLLDHEFVEWGGRLPEAHTFADGELKKTLKDHLATRVPREIIERPKMGFAVPLEYWLKGQSGLRGLADGLKSNNPKNQFYMPFKTNGFDEILNMHGREDLSGILWLLLFTETWFQKHFC